MGPADLEAMGFDVVAVDLLELAVSPGLEVLARAGGFAGFTGWRGTVLALVRPAAARTYVGSSGWRARGRPALVSEQGDELTLRSSVDGALHHFTSSGLARAALDLGATPLDSLLPAGRLAWWEAIREVPPAGEWVVSAVAAAAAREGLAWSGPGWTDIAEVDDAAARGDLAEGCACRACELAEVGYIAHLWRQREITAMHLLGWHNLHQARLMLGG